MPSWFRRLKAPQKPASEPARGPSLASSSSDLVEVLNETPIPQDRLRPRQFAPPRLATLYFTKSEEDLFVNQLRVFDDGPDLILHAQPAPALPVLEIDRSPITTPDVPYPTTPLLFPASIPGSPSLPMPRKPMKPHHALLTISGDNAVRTVEFPAHVVYDIEQALRTWTYGLAARSEPPEALAKRNEGEVLVWKAELRGRVWRLKGSQELDSIRLLLAIFAAVGKHGYRYVSEIQPAVSKPDQHNLVFRWVPNQEAPAYFAITLPLPDRLSVVSPPPRAADAIIESIRTAIVSTHARTALKTPTRPGEEIKLQGWVHAGVYRFWLAGLRRWPGGTGGVKRDVVARLQPPLVLAIMDALMAHHFNLIGSVPFLPRTPGRDVLLFESQPASGLTARNAWGVDFPDEHLSRRSPRLEVNGHAHSSISSHPKLWPARDARSLHRHEPSAFDPTAERRPSADTSICSTYTHASQPSQSSKPWGSSRTATPGTQNGRSPTPQSAYVNGRTTPLAVRVNGSTTPQAAYNDRASQERPRGFVAEPSPETSESEYSDGGETETDSTASQSVRQFRVDEEDLLVPPRMLASSPRSEASSPGIFSTPPSTPPLPSPNHELRPLVIPPTPPAVVAVGPPPVAPPRSPLRGPTISLNDAKRLSMETRDSVSVERESILERDVIGAKPNAVVAKPDSVVEKRTSIPRDIPSRMSLASNASFVSSTSSRPRGVGSRHTKVSLTPIT